MRLGGWVLPALVVSAGCTLIGGYQDFEFEGSEPANGNGVGQGGSAGAAQGGNGPNQGGGGSTAQGGGGGSPQGGNGGSTPVVAVSVTAGGEHSCAALSDGTAKCWGLNTNGQLGDGSETMRNEPVSVANLSNAAMISGGGYAISSHTCAILANSHARCWGYNFSGQLGNNTTASSSYPTDVSVLQGAAEPAIGGDFSCARLNTGDVRCWGDNYHGQLGNGDKPSDSVVMVAVKYIDTAQAIGAGLFHVCVVLQNNTLRCWGDNTGGQLGNGGTADEDEPISVGIITNASKVAAGGVHTCALLLNGTISCWGRNTNGELGDGTNDDREEPDLSFLVQNINDATAIGCGLSHCCAVVTGGGLKCWGDNAQEQLGANTPSASNTPLTVNIANVVEVDGGDFHTCARLVDGTVRCWGHNGSGQLGNGTYDDSASPVQPTGL